MTDLVPESKSARTDNNDVDRQSTNSESRFSLSVPELSTSSLSWVPKIGESVAFTQDDIEYTATVIGYLLYPAMLHVRLDSVNAGECRGIARAALTGSAHEPLFPIQNRASILESLEIYRGAVETEVYCVDQIFSMALEYLRMCDDDRVTDTSEVAGSGICDDRKNEQETEIMPICKGCGGVDSLSASTTSRWHSTGTNTGYWIITSDPGAEIDYCDICGEDPVVEFG